MNKRDIRLRLDYLRKQIRKECISYQEIAELQSLAPYIEKGDVELLQWAGVKEKKPFFDVLLENLGTPNKNEVVLDKGTQSLTLYFSYKTIVAYRLSQQGKYPLWVVSENDWSRTTGKLLNEIEPDKKKRVPYSFFKMSLNDTLREFAISTFTPEKEVVEK